MRYQLLLIVLVGFVATGLSTADAQQSADPYSARIEMGPQSYTWQAARGANRMPGRTAQNYFGGVSTGAPQGNAATKPFNTVVSQPTISPYLNLNREETSSDIPNYYTYVRPQQQQLEANRRQQMMVNQLQQRVQQATYNAPMGGAQMGGRTAARFGDTKQYYGGFNR